MQNRDLEALNRAWKQNSEPFPHLVIEDFLEVESANEKYAELQDYVRQQKASFVKYDQSWERLKFTQNKLDKMPEGIANLVRYLNSGPFLRELEKITGLEGLHPDDNLWGGGIHCTLAGGNLNIHNDFTVLPTSYGQPKEWHRVLNLIVYLNANWQKSWAGQLELWDSKMTELKGSIDPVFNRAVLFYTYGSNHGQPDPYLGPEDEPRLSIATYYYQLVDPGTIPHRSTLYQVRPGEVETHEQRQARLERASAERYSKLKGQLS